MYVPTFLNRKQKLRWYWEHRADGYWPERLPDGTWRIKSTAVKGLDYYIMRYINGHWHCPCPVQYGLCSHLDFREIAEYDAFRQATGQPIDPCDRWDEAEESVA